MHTHKQCDIITLLSSTLDLCVNTTSHSRSFHQQEPSNPDTHLYTHQTAEPSKSLVPSTNCRTGTHHRRCEILWRSFSKNTLQNIPIHQHQATVNKEGDCRGAIISQLQHVVRGIYVGGCNKCNRQSPTADLQSLGGVQR